MDEDRCRAALSMYELAWNACKQLDPSTFAGSVDWARNVGPPSTISDETCWGEYNWCVLNAGMSERIARIIQNRLFAVFWDCPIPWVAAREQTLLAPALKAFNHPGKVRAMLSMAARLEAEPGIGPRLEAMGTSGALQYLESLPWIGRITKYHLARNIGFDVVKPDRHLQRLADLFRTTPHGLCESIGAVTGERVGVMDYVLWQWVAWVGWPEAARVVGSLMQGGQAREATA